MAQKWSALAGKRESKCAHRLKCYTVYSDLKLPRQVSGWPTAWLSAMGQLCKHDNIRVTVGAESAVLWPTYAEARNAWVQSHAWPTHVTVVVMSLYWQQVIWDHFNPPDEKNQTSYPNYNVHRPDQVHASEVYTYSLCTNVVASCTALFQPLPCISDQWVSGQCKW